MLSEIRVNKLGYTSRFRFDGRPPHYVNILRLFRIGALQHPIGQSVFLMGHEGIGHIHDARGTATAIFGCEPEHAREALVIPDYAFRMGKLELIDGLIVVTNDKVRAVSPEFGDEILLRTVEILVLVHEDVKVARTGIGVIAEVREHCGDDLTNKHRLVKH